MTTYLVDHELCHPLVELAVGTVEDHLQHVSVHLLHDDIHLHTVGHTTAVTPVCDTLHGPRLLLAPHPCTRTLHTLGAGDQ